MDPQVALAIITLFALFVSLFSLWKSTLAPFRLEVTTDSPTFNLYLIEPGTSGGPVRWWIPSIDMDITFSNLGKRVGEVKDLRFNGVLRSDGQERGFVFYAKWVVDFRLFQRDRVDRMAWVTSSVERDWYNLVLAGDDQRSLHLIFEGLRWEKAVAGELLLTLQLLSSRDEEWVDLAQYRQVIVPAMFERTSSQIMSGGSLGRARERAFEEWGRLLSGSR